MTGRTANDTVNCVVSVAAAATLLFSTASAQSTGVTARVASVAGSVVLSARDGVPPFALSRGYALNPGDGVDTRGGGRAVIDLSDGSIVVVQPETVLVIKDFRAAASLRELFEILAGAVRVKINHFSGRPNPYRMNSPTASIAVRGTEFDVAVGPEGETNVEVFDGAVEVVSLADPTSNVLIEAGRGVLVRPGVALQIYGVPAWREIARNREGPRQSPPRAAPPDSAARSSEMHTASHDSRVRPGVPAGVIKGSKTDIESGVELQPQALSAYDRYIGSLADTSHQPFAYRFNALSDTYLDSSENPAMAVNVHEGEAHLLVVPMRSRTSMPYTSAGGAVAGTSAEHGIAPQIAFFQPTFKGRVVFGGAFGVWRVGRSTSSSIGLPNLFSSGTDADVFSSAAILAAIKLGSSGKHAVGVQLESLTGSGSVTTAGQRLIETITSRSTFGHKRLTVGYAGQISDRHVVSAFVRYGLIDGSNGDSSRITDSRGQSREAGVRLRGSITPKLSYGVVAALSTLSVNDGFQRFTLANSYLAGRAVRGTFAFGVSRAIEPGTVVSLDAAGGVSRIASENLTMRFASLHAAIHRDLSRRLFASASLVGVWRSDSVVSVSPGRLGPGVLLSGTFSTVTPYNYGNRYSEFGIGWRLSPELSAEYVYGTDYGWSSATHAVMLRYKFRLARH